MIPHISLLLHALTSITSLLLPHLLRLPSLLLQSLHTYIHPDHLPSPSSSSLRAAIRRPSQDPTQEPPNKSRSKSKSKSLPHFDESKAQLFRLRLSGPHLASRAHFPSFRSSFLLSSLSLSNLSLSLLLTHLSPPPLLLSLLSLSFLSLSLFSLSLDPSAHPKSLHRSLFLSASLGFILSFFLLSPKIHNFPLPLPLLCGFLAASLYSPSARAARSFWLGTDQLRWNLSVVSCGPISRSLLYLSAILTILAPPLWFYPVGAAGRHRIGVLSLAAVSQILAVRPNVQMYLNEAVLCWYQRLHSSRVPDLDYGRAKVFLHNHYVCLVASQFFVPPVMVLALLGVSQLRGNLFGAFLLDYSDIVKECALFLAWWIVLVQGVLMASSLALYRLGYLFVS